MPDNTEEVRRYPIWLTRDEAEYLQIILKPYDDSYSESVRHKIKSVLNLKIK
jgi:hypothetical protein